MFDWYQNSRICYVYLRVVTIDAHGDLSGQTLADSRWFRRGWTLQKLLTPYRVEIYDPDWQYVGSTRDLCDQLARITGIQEKYLLHRDSITTAGVAARMSCASRRSTTRPEDQAYCLLGIFDINLPMIYGEDFKRRL